MGDAAAGGVPALLDSLERAHAALLARGRSTDDERARLLTVASDFRWYAGRLGPARWDRAPRAGAWDFATILRHVAEGAVGAVESESALPVRYFIDHGKEHVGQVAELWFVLAAAEARGAG